MSEYVIKGGKPLVGTVMAQGSKNSAVAVLMACIAVRGRVVLRRVPFISDVVDCIGILRYLGGVVEWLEDRSLCVDCSDIEYKIVPAAICGRIRASTYIMGAFLNRFGRCPALETGGCAIGARPVDLHVGALSALGARPGVDGELSVVESLDGEYRFPRVTVGGTVNALLASVCGGGKCVLRNCAREPHVCDLIGFLNACGADINGEGGDVLTVCSVGGLHGCGFELSGDMIEAGTYLLAGVATRGEITVNGIASRELRCFCRTLSEMGVNVSSDDYSISVSGAVERGTRVETGAFPLFPTDLHPQTVAVMGSVRYESELRERVFGADRFGYLTELEKQGLHYEIRGDAVTVRGGGYHAARVCATDLRGGAASVIAALCTDGESVIRRGEYIDRGYSDLVLKLRSVGADIMSGG